jgi:CP family cyanate transporter-like MFS transporter
MSQSQTLSSTDGASLRLLLAIFMVALNLRGAVTCVGPLLSQIQSALGLSATAAGLLASLPIFAFACISPYAAAFARLIGIELAIFLSLLLFIAGLGIRYIPGTGFLYCGTVLIGIGIAVSNVLLPGLLRREFPQRLALVTAMFTMAMVLAGSLGSGLAIPLASWGGWRISLLAWALPALLALLVWIPHLKHNRSAMPQPAKAREIPMWSNALAWQVSLFMACQSTAFYVLIAWLPRMLNDLEGISAAQAGWILFIYQLFVLLSVVITPVFIHRLKDQSGIAVVCSLLILIGFSGLLLATHYAMMWMILMGLGAGDSLVLAMTLLGLRVSSASQSVSLSGMAQSIGYTMAALTPVLIGYLYDHTHRWSVPLLLMLGVGLLQMGVGYLAGRPLTVTVKVAHGTATFQDGT